MVKQASLVKGLQQQWFMTLRTEHKLCTLLVFTKNVFVCLLVGLDAFKEDGKTSVFCQGPPTTMIYDFADGAQTFHNVSFFLRYIF